MGGTHVHLSADVNTARHFGRGRPFVFTVDAEAMTNAGIEFHEAANGVWLVVEVPPGYLRQSDGTDP